MTWEARTKECSCVSTVIEERRAWSASNECYVNTAIAERRAWLASEEVFAKTVIGDTEAWVASVEVLHMNTASGSE
jgi:hypothetical protein